MAQKGFLSLNAKSHQPVRPAPPPPVAVKHAQSLGSSSRSSPMGQGHDSKKKNAPPRPPPPKPSAQLKAVHNAVIFTEMLQKSHSSSQMASTPSSGPPQDLLISWDAPSPSTSPTPGRYSSDGLSLRSFGSDSSGIMANGGNLSHANSRSESGFESEPDAWSETTTSYAPPPVVAAAAAESIKPFVMPTIIRPNRPTKPVSSNSSSTHLQALEKKINASNSNCDLLSDLIEIQCPTIDNSPPEPTIPPPAPPSFLDEPESSSGRNSVIDQRSQPCAEALYDYNSSHPGDLKFKEGDRILLESRVNDEWLRGSVGSQQGIFPVSFVHILVPLQELEEVEEEKPQASVATQSPQGNSSSYRAVAIYPFEAETSQDLSLQEGDEVDVSESLGNGWLYGRECLSGRYGQFPEAFVRAV